MKNIVFIVTNKEGEVVYASLNKNKAFDYAFENGFAVTGCELDN